MALVDVVNEKTGEVIKFDNEMNYFSPDLYTGDEISESEMKALRRESRWILQQYGYNTESIQTVLNEWAQNKGWLINLLKRHPKYVDGKFQIAFESEIERKISKSGIRKAREWFINHIMDCGMVKEQLAPLTMDEYSKLKERANTLDDMYCKITDLQAYLTDKYIQYLPSGMDAQVKVNGEPCEYYDSLRREAWNKKDKYTTINGKVYMNTVSNIRGYISDIISLLSRVDDQFVSEAFAQDFNTWASGLGIKTEAKKGQKISKLYSKFFIEIGMSDFKDIQDYTFHDQNGVEHTKQKDYGFNYYFYSVFADSVNPVKFKRHTVISVNPIDYWTMSFGNSWASCQTIDVDKRRSKQGGMSNNYGGMYSAGTESYMLDGSTIVFYYVDSNCKSDFELEDKYKRCLFYLGENKLIQSRVYPDGRDGVDEDEDSTAAQIAKDIREVMEEVISECAGVPNSWVYKGGVGTADSMIQSYGSHYRDYSNYNDCGTAFLKIGERLMKNTNKIHVGHETICPSCGNVHSNNNNIQCEECITRTRKGKQVTFLKAFRYSEMLFETEKDRDEYVKERADGGNISDVINSLHEEDAERLAEITEEMVPSTPFLNSETENENVNDASENETVA